MRGDTKCGITFLSKNKKLFSGIALKRTCFPRDHDFSEAIKTADKYHRFVLIDYEGRKNLLGLGQLNSLLKKFQNVLIFTIAVRGVEFHENNGNLLEKFLQLSNKYANLSFCVVAGHPSYRDSINTNISSVKSFVKFIGRIREQISTPILLGAENLSSSIINNLKNIYDPILPNLLHGDSRLFQTNGINGIFAVYSPITNTNPDENAIQPLIGYLLRRKLTQSKLRNAGFSPSKLSYNWERLPTKVQEILLQCYRQYTLNSANFEEKTQKFLQYGGKLIFGHPINSENSIDLIKGFNLNKHK